MNPRLLNYALAAVAIAVGSYLVIQLTSTQVEQTEITGTAENFAEATPVIQPAPPNPEPNPEVAPKPETGQKPGLHTGVLLATETDSNESSDAQYTDNEILGFIFDADFDPVYDDTGFFTGFRISSLPDDALSMMAAPKLWNGDIITQINDIKLIDENSLVTAIEQLYNTRDKSILTFSVERNGASYSIPLEFQP